ncbi:hypothetical protein [Acinetobacter defluvii]|uniref:hypothetical protein n=1 Tax=Acinetobacter defluvii TaxID=1871111 RepID=UPI003AF6964B
MKKIMAVLVLIGYTQLVFADAAEHYARQVEKISTQYNTQMKSFLRSLNPKITQFDAQQKAQYCDIVKTYVDDMYKATDENRSNLPPSYMSITKQDIINKVNSSPEMQILKKYNIQCDLNNR